MAYRLTAEDLPRWTWVSDVGLLGLRLFAGLALAFAHGRGKLPPSERFIAGAGDLGFPVPIVFAWAAALSEFVAAHHPDWERPAERTQGAWRNAQVFAGVRSVLVDAGNLDPNDVVRPARLVPDLKLT